MDIRTMITVLNEEGNSECAEVIVKLLEERDCAIQYIPRRCQTCRYLELVAEPKRTCCCTRSDMVCYAWKPSGWEWNGKPPEKDINRLWNWL